MAKEKIKTRKELETLVVQLKEKNKKIVTTNGVFDILHVGHIRYLQKAKFLGDVLVVLVNSDMSVRKLKGPLRPLNIQRDRAEALAALACVDYVAIFEEDTPQNFLEFVKPHIHVKGGDYSIAQIVERNAVENNGGKVVLIPMEKGYSTTRLIEKICRSYGK